MEKLKLSVPEIAEVSGETKDNIYLAIQRGDLVTFVVGRRRFARPEAVRRWVDYLESESHAGRPVRYQARSRERPAA